MQIAQIAPLTEAIPPKLYGGTERVISWLTDELVALGHEVVLFASGDSQTSAHLETGTRTPHRRVVSSPDRMTDSDVRRRARRYAASPDTGRVGNRPILRGRSRVSRSPLASG